MLPKGGEAGHGRALGGLCAHNLLLEAGHPCVGSSVSGVMVSPREWRPR